MMRAIICLMGRWPGGLMASSRERIIDLMEAVVGSMGDESSRERIIGLMGAVVGSMVGPLMAAEKQSSEGGLLQR